MAVVKTRLTNIVFKRSVIVSKLKKDSLESLAKKAEKIDQDIEDKGLAGYPIGVWIICIIIALFIKWDEILEMFK